MAANGQRGKAVPDGNSLATVADLGLTRKAIHEARQLRDAEAADPGVIRRTLDARLERGQEPTLLPQLRYGLLVIALENRCAVMPTIDAGDGSMN